MRPGTSDAAAAAHTAARAGAGLFAQARREKGRMIAGLGGALALVFVCSLFVGVDTVEFYAPSEVFSCYSLALHQVLAPLSGTAPLANVELLAEQPHYYQITERLSVTAMTCVCGALLAVAGSVYQLAFRNPVAAPTMLGSAAGVRLGMLVAIVFYGASAGFFTARLYVFAFGFSLALLGIVFGCSRLITPRKNGAVNVVDMLLVGTIVSSLVGVVIAYVQDYVLDDSQYLLFQQLSEALTVDTGPFAWGMLVVVAVFTLVPLLLCRFAINMLAMGDEDARMLGMDTATLRVVAVVAATLMMVASQLLMGTVSMICLVVPHISRALFGANFAKQFLANMSIGSATLVACRLLCSLIPFVGYGFPLGTAVSLVALPAFVWIIAIQQRKWTVE